MVPAETCHSDFRLAICTAYSLVVLRHLVVMWATGFTIEPGCGRSSDSDIVLGGILGMDVTMPPGGCIGHTDMHQHGFSLTLSHQKDPKWGPGLWSSLPLPMVTNTMDMKTEPGGCRAMEPDMTPGFSSSLDESIQIRTVPVVVRLSSTYLSTCDSPCISKFRFSHISKLPSEIFISQS